MLDRPHVESISETLSVFFHLIEIVSWLAIVSASIVLWSAFPLIALWQKLTVTISMIAFVAWVYHWFLPRYGSRRWMYLPILVAQVAMVSYAAFVFPFYDITDFFFVVIGIAAILSDWYWVTLGVLLATATDVLVRLLRAQPVANLIVSVSFDVFIMLITAYLLGSLRHMIQRQITSANQRNRELLLLLDLSAPVEGFLDLHAIVPSSARKIAVDLPVTFCRIALLAEEDKSLVNCGAYPLRPLPAHLAVGERWSLEHLNLHRQALASGQPLIVRADQPPPNMSDLERQMIVFDEIQSACLVPFGIDDAMIGVIDLGEARRWERSPFDGPKIELLKSIARQLAIVIQNAQLHQIMRKQAERFLVLNEVAHAIGSTIEMDKLLELIYQELRQVISTDTYYVALYNSADETIDLRILIDEGQRFPPKQIPVRSGLVSLVIQNRRAMLFNHLSEERSSLPVQPVSVGSPRQSESWLGVPLMSDDNLLGMLVIASYTAFAFTEDDERMMGHLAEQVVLALDNASHHANVEMQSRCDSLTGAFNHGYVIERLHGEVESAQQEHFPVSLIMLDIDFFKQYNDTFGHVVGDAVLRATVKAIQAHIKRVDAVGRWGGEEFAVVLRDASAEQARQVAERIRETMAALTLKGTQGQPVPAPTVSQGIATFPDHAINADALVVEADRTLYRAKANGRDQVAVARSK